MHPIVSIFVIFILLISIIFIFVIFLIYANSIIKNPNINSVFNCPRCKKKQKPNIIFIDSEEIKRYRCTKCGFEWESEFYCPRCKKKQKPNIIDFFDNGTSLFICTICGFQLRKQQ